MIRRLKFDQELTREHQPYTNTIRGIDNFAEVTEILSGNGQKKYTAQSSHGSTSKASWSDLSSTHYSLENGKKSSGVFRRVRIMGPVIGL